MFLCALQPEFQGMLPVEEGEFTTLQRSAFRWPDRLKQAAAVCNALSFVSRKQAVGDVCEREVFKAVEAQFLVSRVAPRLAPLRTAQTSPQCRNAFLLSPDVSELRSLV